MRKGIGWGLGVLAWAAASIATLLLALAFLPTLFGFETLIVASGSMGRTLPIGSAALTRAIEAEAIETGDVVSYRHNDHGETTTHRVVAIDHQPGQVVFTTKGDANANVDPEKVVVSGRIHRVEHVVPLAGHVIRHARTPYGGVGLILVPILGLILDRRSRSGTQRRAKAPWRKAPVPDPGWSTTTYHLVRVTPRATRSEPGG